MTKDEFSMEMTWLSVAIGKPIAEDGAVRARLRAYYEMLGHLPHELFAVAVRIAASRHVWSTFPSIAELKTAATDAIRQDDDFGDVWADALHACQSMTMLDYHNNVPRNEWNERCLDLLPAVLRRAVQAFGWQNLTNDSTVRAQFRRVYEEMRDKEHERLLLPPAVAKQIGVVAPLQIEDKSSINRRKSNES